MFLKLIFCFTDILKITYFTVDKINYVVGLTIQIIAVIDSWQKSFPSNIWIKITSFLNIRTSSTARWTTFLYFFSRIHIDKRIVVWRVYFCNRQWEESNDSFNHCFKINKIFCCNNHTKKFCWKDHTLKCKNRESPMRPPDILTKVLEYMTCATKYQYYPCLKKNCFTNLLTTNP